MCGIAGVLLDSLAHRGPGSAVSNCPQDILDPMLDRLEHRGPDGRHSVHLNGQASGIALGHTRLAILDPSPAGRQPMSDPATRNWITYNGEMYNYRELRHRLGADGWRSQTDTEVVLRAYSRWGLGCLERFRGMFAFAIWDSTRQELFIARDRL